MFWVRRDLTEILCLLYFTKLESRESKISWLTQIIRSVKILACASEGARVFQLCTKNHPHQWQIRHLEPRTGQTSLIVLYDPRKVCSLQHKPLDHEPLDHDVFTSLDPSVDR